MNLNDISKIRLLSQHIAAARLHTPKAIVAWMGAMQAQDYAMAKWAVGVRLPGASGQLVEDAISRGEILRTHLLRPTWHLVSADDLGWMLALTAPHVKTAIKSRHQELGLTAAVREQGNRLIVQALQGGKHLTREEIVATWQQAGMDTGENRAAHMLLLAELDGLVCSGSIRNGKQTYALLSERLPQGKPLTRQEALAALAKRYFTSHGPATLQDFIWWSGLPAGEARRALEMAQPALATEAVGSTTYWLDASLSMPPALPEMAHYLPAFDEFIISYTDRTAALLHEDHSKAVSKNGIFRPVIVVDGQVIGIWKRTIKKDKVLIESQSFKPMGPELKNKIEAAAFSYAQFVAKELSIEINSDPQT